jgi:hypothetical protein
MVRLRAGEPMRTSPEIAGRALSALPGLARHACRNPEGLSFAEELADTEIPHLLEHVALELLTLAGASTSPDGETTWDFARDGERTFVVSLCCPDERLCREAVRLAARVLRWAVEGGTGPDLTAATARLARLRARRMG